jgi:hypothetical protein
VPETKVPSFGGRRSDRPCAITQDEAARHRTSTINVAPTASSTAETTATSPDDEPVDGSVDRSARTVTVDSGGAGIVDAGVSVAPSTVGGTMLAGADVTTTVVVVASVVGMLAVVATVGEVVLGAGHAGMPPARTPGHDGPAVVA